MRLIYDLGIRIYYLLILLASPFNSKAKLWIGGRRGLLRRMATEVDAAEPLTWFHCSSLGEFEQGRPVIEKIRSPSHVLFPFRIRGQKGLPWCRPCILPSPGHPAECKPYA